MLTFLAIVGMMLASLRILWDGQIPVSRTRVATGMPVKLLGFALLLAAPLAYAVSLFVATQELPSVVPRLSDDERDYLFIAVLLGTPALFAIVAILLDKPIGETSPPT